LDILGYIFNDIGWKYIYMDFFEQYWISFLEECTIDNGITFVLKVSHFAVNKSRNRINLETNVFY